MFSVSGHFVVNQITAEREYNSSGYYINLEVITQHPRKRATPDNPEAARVYQKVSIFVPKEKITEAREKLQRGANVIIRCGELASNRTPQGHIYSDVHVQWNNLQFLRMIPE